MNRGRSSASGRPDPLNAARQRTVLANALPVREGFEATLQEAGLAEPRRGPLRVLQLNLGRLCNMRCSHCHVDAGPDQGHTLMTDDVVQECLEAIRRLQPDTVDLTGGAPELHPRFQDLVRAARSQGCHVIDRCNLTVLLLPATAGLANFLAEQQVEIVASLPQPEPSGTDRQRGLGTWEASIQAMRLLNGLGYGGGDPARRLTLMSNPCGTQLQQLTRCDEHAWKGQLQERAGVHFDRLIGLNNMPIARFLKDLEDAGRVNGYLNLLKRAFNPDAVNGLMCRDTLSVAPDGRLHDCDFNQMLDLALGAGSTPRGEPDAKPHHIGSVTRAQLVNQPIQWGNHCFGCTAGQGSSCSGATTA